MSPTSVLAVAFAIGVIAGLRALTAPAVVSWAARIGWLSVQGRWCAFLGYAATPYLFTLLAIAELVNDKLPKTPSRKAPPSFVIRIVMGAFSGAALGAGSVQRTVLGALAGGLGAVAGTLGGYEARTRLVKALGTPDFFIALLEDAVAIGAGLILVSGS